MTQPFNSASRILAIFEQVRSGSLNEHTFKVWGNAFNLPFNVKGSNEPELVFEVADALRLLRGEIYLLEKRLKSKFKKPERYMVTIDRIRTVTQLNYLYTEWRFPAEHLTESVFDTLSIFVEILPSDSKEVDDATLDELAEHITQLENEVLHGDYPEEIKRYLLHQIAVMLNAVRYYNIVGIRAFHDAMAEIMGNTAANSSVAREAAANEGSRAVINRLVGAYRTVMDRAGEVATLVEIAEAITKLLPGA